MGLCFYVVLSRVSNSLIYASDQNKASRASLNSLQLIIFDYNYRANSITYFVYKCFNYILRKMVYTLSFA